ncbi:hypothetical protein [Roseomonas sp. KE0001]|uniref:hypothetical protein n=1 Tax=Roseomonas sp. KE0001 TaxID=2479201 RepID=UPI0018E041C9|nr:hypothetical protein [Roseomonas sp. KE0001]
MIRARLPILLGPLLLGLCLAGLVPPQGARGQPAAPAAEAPPLATPAGLRGAWFAGDCAAPGAMLQVTARAVARLPADGPARLVRFTGMRQAEGWSIGTGRGAEAPRMMLRGDPASLESAEPDAKLRDDRLPGETPIRSWRRCPIPPPAFAARHGEGLAVLSSLEVLEAACGGPAASMAGCIAALMGEADVSGDRLLSPAEISRLVRGMAWVLAAAEDAAPEALVAAGGGGVIAGMAVARLTLESLDYDGDGKLSATELAQDRSSFSRATGSEAGRPLRLEGVQEGMSLMRSLLDSLLLED